MSSEELYYVGTSGLSCRTSGAFLGPQCEKQHLSLPIDGKHLTDVARYFRSVQYTGPRHTNHPLASDPIHLSARDCDIKHAIRHLLRQQVRGNSNSHLPRESCLMQLMLLLSCL